MGEKTEISDNAESLNGDISRQVAQARAFEYISRMRINAMSGALPSAYLAWLLWDSVPVRSLLTWWCILLAVDMSSAVHATVFVRQAQRITNPKTWAWRQTWLQNIVGVIWGSAMIWYQNSETTTTDIPIVMLGAYAVSTMSQLHYRSFAMLYTAAFWTVPLVLWLHNGGAHERRLATGIIVLALSILVYVLQVSEQLSTGLFQRFEAKALAAKLKRSNEEIERLASYDDLCGCLNRRRGMASLRETSAAGPPMSIMIIDADHFKDVNDTHGHPAGDEVLRELAKRLESSVRQGDVVARFGGEEFLVVAPGADSKRAKQVADRLLHAVSSEPIRFDDISIPITVSVGLAELKPSSATTPEALLAMADRALYQAKQQGRNRVVVAFAPDPDKAKSQTTKSIATPPPA